VGCIGRRSPGRSGGRGPPTPGAPCGRGRWKIGCPGTGLPGAGRMVPTGAPDWATGAGGRGGGALYTGRGPVCGTIMRGPGVAAGAEVLGAAGRGGTSGAAGAVGAEDAIIDGDAGAADVTLATGGTGGGAGRGGATGTAGTGGGGAGLSTGWTTAGRTGGGGATGAVTGGGGGATGAAGFGAGGAITGLATTGGTGGRTGAGGAAAASFFCVIALSTSPGREMCDRSILVLISSSPRGMRAERPDDVCASDEPRMWARTFSASCSSRELECVFFSVTPTSGSASRIALLLTSSSLARSLIRTLLIRPFFSALAYVFI
jgi:hypothetical protein